MKRQLLFLILFVFVSHPLMAQASKYKLDPDGIEVYDQYRKSTGFLVFSPEVVSPSDTLGVVIFLHGFGGLNPLNYGAWLRQLIEAGNVVIYPRYQKSIFLSRPKQFAKNAAEGIRGGLDYISSTSMVVDTSRLVYVGHSYGGTLSAYMMAKEDSLGFPKAYAGLLAAPGTSRLKGSRLSEYSAISQEAQLLIVTHEGDRTVGSEFAELVHRTATNTHSRVWIKQAEQTIDTFSISQGHNECYALDDSFDNGYRNFNTKRAIRISRTDVVDRNLYWPLSIEMTQAARNKQTIELLREKKEAFAFGVLPNGLPLESLPVSYGRPVEAPMEREIEGF